MLLIFFSPMYLERVSVTFTGICLAAPDGAGWPDGNGIGTGTCTGGLSCATTGTSAPPTSVSARTSSFLMQHTPLSGFTSIDAGTGSALSIRYDKDVDGERRDNQVCGSRDVGLFRVGER